VVFFGTFNYYWNMERNFSKTIGKIDPGDSYEYILGMAVALSERISLSLSFQNILTASTEQNGVKLPNSNLNAASLFLGASYRFGRYATVYANVGMGLTADSPDFQVQLNFPFTFSLF
jgi:opacity protein-like surface antigen